MDVPKFQKLKSRIAELRKETGMTQAELAAFVRVSTTTVQNWEADKGLEQIERLQRLCAILNCQLDDLVEYVPTAEPAEAVKRPLPLTQLRQIGLSFRGESIDANDADTTQEQETYND
jgi:transcriptional regulator with XRE-family HTH domain